MIPALAFGGNLREITNDDSRSDPVNCGAEGNEPPIAAARLHTYISALPTHFTVPTDQERRDGTAGTNLRLSINL